MLCKNTQVKCRPVGRLAERPSDDNCSAHHLNDLPALREPKARKVLGDFDLCRCQSSECALALYGDCTLCPFAWRF